MKKEPIIISGPCSAESRDQVLETAQALLACKQVSTFRSGIWKPRSRPNTFEGVGSEGLNWLKEVRERFGFKLAVEVATPNHVKMAVEAGIDFLWLGARTTSNPFSVQELSSALRGCEKTVLVKNPVNPDLELWIGAIERLSNSRVERLMAIHRGFFPFEQTPYRNIPKWEVPIELKTRMPDLPIICDPSHIAGHRHLVPEIAQYALDLNFDGLMIESHIDPDKALSDGPQQLKPDELIKMISSLKFRSGYSSENGAITEMEQLRNQIDSIDSQIIELLAQRMETTKKIGHYKNQYNIAAFQLNRWKRIIRSRIETGAALGLQKDFVKRMLQIVHKESIRIQSELMKRDKE